MEPEDLLRVPEGSAEPRVRISRHFTDPFASKGLSASNGLQCNVP